MSRQSSAQYYRLANEVVGEQLGGLHSARCALALMDFAHALEGYWADHARHDHNDRRS